MTTIPITTTSASYKSNSGHIRRFLASPIRHLKKYLIAASIITKFVPDTQSSKENNVLAIKEYLIKTKAKLDALNKFYQRVIGGVKDINRWNLCHR